MSSPLGGFPPGYEWDDDKNQANIRRHGIDFRDAVRVFDKPTLIGLIAGESTARSG